MSPLHDNEQEPAAPNAAPALGQVQHQPVPYGQACAGCAKAKCRCRRSATAPAAPCERCQRLRRACEPSRANRKRGGGVQRNRTAQIEEKLDSLVSILISQGQKPAVSSEEAQAVPVALAPSSAPSAVLPADSGTSATSSRAGTSGANGTGGYSTGASPDSDHGTIASLNASDTTLAGVDQMQAKENLRIFRTLYLPAFPAVRITPTITSSQLESERPYLWLAIQAICSRPYSARVDLQERVRKILAERVAVHYECSMDLLMAYTVLGMWGTCTSGTTNAFFISASMTTTLAQNLKLDRPPDLGPTGFQALAYSFPSSSTTARNGNEQLAERKRTDEECRAVLACFCLSSSIFHKLGTQLMRWTPHMNDCLRHLESHPTCENDEVLVIQTKCTRILDAICASSPTSFRGGAHEGLSSIHGLMAKTAKGHLDEVRGHVRFLLLENRVVKYWLLLTNIMTLDIELQGSADVAPGADLLLQRAQLIQSCLTFIKLFVDNVLAFTTQEHGGLHIHYWIYYIRCLRIVYRLRLTENTEFNNSNIWEIIDLADSLQQGSEACRAVPMTIGLHVDGRNTYTLFADNLLRVKSIWGEALSQAAIRRAGDETSIDVGPDTSHPAFLNDLDATFDFFDDTWMADVFLPTS